jgi:hypothetical protein
MNLKPQPCFTSLREAMLECKKLLSSNICQIEIKKTEDDKKVEHELQESHA